MEKKKIKSSNVTNKSTSIPKTLVDAYASRSGGTLDRGDMYNRYENGNFSAGNYSYPDSQGVYVNNNGYGAYARNNNYDGTNNYVAGITNPNWNLPTQERSVNTPLGTVSVGTGDGDTAYLSYAPSQNETIAKFLQLLNQVRR